MELYALWDVVKRRWWLAAIPVIVTVAFAALRYDAPPSTWTVGMRFTAAQAPEPDAMPDATDPYEDANYVPWLASEYLVNGLAHWVQTQSFAEAVSETLAAGGVEIDGWALYGAFASDNQRSVMGVYVTWGDRDQIEAIAAAAVSVLQTRSGEYFPQTAANPITVTPLDAIGVGEVAPSIMSRLKPFWPVAIGVVAGLALAFVVEYLDPTIRAREELEALGIEVLGVVPRGK
jgi:capsular polysaccharide biosynthesis protein